MIYICSKYLNYKWERRLSHLVILSHYFYYLWRYVSGFKFSKSFLTSTRVISNLLEMFNHQLTPLKFYVLWAVTFDIVQPFLTLVLWSKKKTWFFVDTKSSFSLTFLIIELLICIIQLFSTKTIKYWTYHKN